jgi:replicative DNA helicase
VRRTNGTIEYQNLEKAPLFIDDTPLYFDLRAKARRLVSQHETELLLWIICN